jgi:hypothetical protein
MFIVRPKPQTQTAESLAALVLSYAYLKDSLIEAVEWSSQFGICTPTVADIIRDCVAEIEAEDPLVVVPSDAIEGAWGIVNDAATAMLYARQDEKAAYERSLDRPGEYESERSGAWNSL